MFRYYGILGIIMVLFSEINFYFKIEPFASWYFPIIWFGYIFLIDSIIYKLRGDSLIMNKKYHFFTLLILSALIWWLFELLNFKVGNWNYSGILPQNWIVRKLYATIAFSTVLPAVIETYELIRTFNLFSKIKLIKHHKITHKFLYFMTYFGFFTLILSVLFPRYFYPFVWLSFYFILDPINYLHKQPSILRYWKSGNIRKPLALFVSGTICGLLWEFWNYYSVTKWYYNIPFVGFFKIFEMPILGYLGYGPFAFELFAMYYFVRSLHLPRRNHSLIELPRF
jgi:hypothetical protein